MNARFDELRVAFETHDTTRIRAVLDAGFDVTAPVEGRTPVAWLTEMYFRSDRFPACLRLLLERGGTLDDPRLAPVLLDDPDALDAAVKHDPGLLAHRTSMVCAFTPLDGATLLHIAAEYGHLAAARRLLELGAEVDARADTDADGFGGQTPLFHTVNSNANRSAPVMQLLLDAGARPDLQLAGLVWGRGFDWETCCVDVTPASYAQLGLLPQMHRDERDCDRNVETLLRAAGRRMRAPRNVPNRYLAS